RPSFSVLKSAMSSSRTCLFVASMLCQNSTWTASSRSSRTSGPGTSMSLTSPPDPSPERPARIRPRLRNRAAAPIPRLLGDGLMLSRSLFFRRGRTDRGPGRLLHGARGEATDDETLSEDHKGEGGQYGEGGAGQEESRVGRLSGLEAVQTDLEGLHLGAACDDQRPEVHVPAGDEHVHADGGQGGLAERQQDRPQEPQVSHAVHACRVVQFAGELLEALPEEECAEGVGQERQDQPR